MTTPAFDLWAAELEAGYADQRPDDVRTWRRDALYRAAQYEQWAELARVAGCPRAAADFTERAAAVIQRAATRRAP